MAKIVRQDQNVIVKPWWGRLNIIYIGLGIGLSWWVLTSLLNRYVVEAIACRDMATAAACVDSYSIAGSIAAVLVAVLGAFVLVRAIQPRPIVIAVATAALLWDLGGLVDGLSWFETLLWALALYALSYGLFSLVARIANIVVSLLSALAVVAIVRLLLVV
jgi:hypothetical protein